MSQDERSAWDLFALRMAEALQNPKPEDSQDLTPLWDNLSTEEQQRFEQMLADVRCKE